MNELLVALLVGAGAGTGLFLAARAVVGRPAPLAAVLARMDRPGVTVTEALTRRSPAERHLHHLLGVLSGWVLPWVPRDLDVCDRTGARHAVEKLTTAGTLAALPLVLAAVGSIGTGTALVGAGILAVAGFVLPDLTLRSAAASRRTDLRSSLSAYLDMVNVLLAGGAGVETAMEAAARTGDGPGFARIRRELLRTRSLRQPVWRTFERLGGELGIEEFTELASSLRLAGEQGARIRSSLAARAAAMRARQQAQVEADAQAASERMGLPTVSMFLGFMVLVGYPAAQLILGGF
jgi:Flp pilus assembly protein TadB